MNATPFNQRTIDEFRAKQGRGVGGWGDNLLLMTSRGSRSGRSITTPLVYRRDGNTYFVVASKGGAPEDPHWYRNIQMNPDVEIEVASGSATERFQARARVVARGKERDRIYEFMTVVWPAFRDRP